MIIQPIHELLLNRGTDNSINYIYEEVLNTIESYWYMYIYHLFLGFFLLELYILQNKKIIL